MTNIFNTQTLKKTRKILRKTMTPAEAGLWNYLKNKQLSGKKFRRQYSVGSYILDFYCPEERLAIELDGEVHTYDKINQKDREKEAYISSLGIRLLRFENKYVFEYLDSVLKKISDMFTTPAGTR